MRRFLQRWVGQPKVGAVALLLALVAAGLRPQAASAAPSASVAQAADLADAGADASSLLVRFRPVVSPAARRDVIRNHGAEIDQPVDQTGFFVVSSGSRPAAALLPDLAADPSVAMVEPNYLRRASAAAPAPVDDALYASYQQDYFELLRLPEAWEVNAGSDDLILAIVDSGVALDHAELAGRLVPGWDFVDRDEVPNDEFGHGTEVATVAGAVTGNGKGLAGVIRRGKILPVKVLNGNGVGKDADIAAGIVWAADHGADVINLSIGGPSASETVRAAVDYARSRDVVLVGAVGNNHSPKPAYPAALDGVVGVSATDHRGAFAASFSNYGPWVDVAAPGVDVLVGTRDVSKERYLRRAGTSYAAPMVAGIALLVRGHFPGDSAEAVIERLRAGARDAGRPGFDNLYGYGIVDGLGALGGPRPAPLGAVGDSREPDGTPERATPLTPGHGLTGTLMSEGDVDWFSVEVAAPRWLDVTVTPPETAKGAPAMDAVVDLFGPDLRWRDGADRRPPGQAEAVTRFWATPGRYHVRVRDRTGAPIPGEYRLEVAAQPAPSKLFAAATDDRWGLGPSAASIAMGDLDGDGAADVLVAASSLPVDAAAGHQLFLFSHAGRGLVEPVRLEPVPLPAAGPGPERTLGLDVGDLDGDGRLDIAVATGDGVQLRYQAGGSPALVPVPGAEHVAIGDLDGDTQADVVVSTASGLRLLHNRGGGRFQVLAGTSVRATEVEVADMDGDGHDDVIAVECPDSCGDTSVYTFGPGGFIRTTSQPAAAAAECVLAAGDVTGEGRRDAVVACAGTGTLRVLPQGESGMLGSPVAYPADFPVDSLEVADVDGDGRQDVVALYRQAEYLHVFRQGEDARLSPEFDLGPIEPDRFGPGGLAVGDLDGDGTPDFAFAGEDRGLGVLRPTAYVPAMGEAVWVRDTSPADGSLRARPTVDPVMRFARAVDPSSLEGASATLTDAFTGTAMPVDVRYVDDTNAVVLKPLAPLPDGRPYEVRIAGLRDTSGATIPPEAGSFRFTVAAQAGEIVPPGEGPVPPSPPGPPGEPVSPAPPHEPAGSPSGYWMLGADGAVYPFGDARHAGEPSTAISGFRRPAADLEPAPGTQGYWVLDTGGAVLGFGVPALGGLEAGTLRPDESATSLSATPTGRGYWVFTTAGRVFAFGDAEPAGDMAAVRLNGPVLDSIATPAGRGYYMVASDGGIFAFGDARFAGSMGDRRLNAPVQSLVPDPDGHGYWLVASDGGVFAFDAGYRGSMASSRLNAPVTGMVPFGNGYLMVASDGGIFNFSDRPFAGSLGDHPPPHPIVAVAALS